MVITAPIVQSTWTIHCLFSSLAATTAALSTALSRNKEVLTPVKQVIMSLKMHKQIRDITRALGASKPVCFVKKQKHSSLAIGIGPWQ